MRVVLALNLLANGLVFGLTPPRPLLYRSDTSLFGSAAIDDDYRCMLSRARQAAVCARTSAAEANTFLAEILSVQEGCASGTLADEALCEDVQETAEVVSLLRHKASREGPPVSAAAALMPLGLVFLFATIHAFAVHGSPNALPFSAQEWFWAFRDGYLGPMFTQYLQHGGMPFIEGESGSLAVPFTPQEWIWAVQGGYLPSLITELYRHGGLLVDTDYLNEFATPTSFSLEEIAWAIQGGYISSMVSHYMRNGGL